MCVRERETSIGYFPQVPQWGTEPATKVCSLTCNQTLSLFSVWRFRCRNCPSTLKYRSRGKPLISHLQTTYQPFSGLESAKQRRLRPASLLLPAAPRALRAQSPRLGLPLPRRACLHSLCWWLAHRRDFPSCCHRGLLLALALQWCCVHHG